MYEAPLTCMTFIKEQKKLAVGMASDQGRVPIFKWGHFGEHVSFPGQTKYFKEAFKEAFMLE